MPTATGTPRASGAAAARDVRPDTRARDVDLSVVVGVAAARRLVRTALRGLAPAVLLVLAVASPAGAHPQLLAAEPAPGAVLAHPPARVRLTFAERVEPGRARLVLETSDGRDLVTSGPGTGASGATLEATPPALASGTYRVRYEALGRDGHVIAGSFAFAVWLPGTPRPPDLGSLDDLGDLGEGSTQGRPRPVALARGLAIASSLPVAGILLVSAAFGGAGRLRRPLALVSVAAALAGDAVVVWGIRPDPLATSFGRLVAAHAALAVAAAVIVAADRLRPRWVPVAVAELLLLTITLTGHNVALAEHRVAAALLDWLHVSAAALWIGLVAHALSAPERGHGLTRRLGITVVAAAVVVVVTGSSAVRTRIPDAAAFLGTSYGRTLLVKLGLVAVVVTLGWAAGRRRWPAERRALLLPEAAGFAAVLAAVAVLVSLVPPSPPRPPAGVPLLAGALVGDQLLSVLVTPYRPGPNTLRVVPVAGDRADEPAERPRAWLVAGGTPQAVPLGPAGEAPLALPDRPARLRLEGGGQRWEQVLDARVGQATRLATLVTLSGDEGEECRSRLVGQMAAVQEWNGASRRAVQLVVVESGRGVNGGSGDTLGGEGITAVVGACGEHAVSMAAAAGLPGPPRPAALDAALDARAIGRTFAVFLGSNGVTRTAVVVDGSERAGNFTSGLADVANGLGMEIVSLPVPDGLSEAGAEALVVVAGWPAARQALAALAGLPRPPPRGVFLAPWLLEPGVLEHANPGPQLSVGLTLDPLSRDARRYLAAVSALAPTEAPTMAGLAGYVEARLALLATVHRRRTASAGDAQAVARETATVLWPGADSRARLRFFTPAHVQVLPELLDAGHRPSAHPWLEGRGLAPVSGVISEPAR